MKIPIKSYTVAWDPKEKKHVVVNKGATFWGGVTRQTAIQTAKKRNAVEREVRNNLKRAKVSHKEMSL